uniref:Protein kinase domain-containing protein n=1 Tax=Heterorhabditis bacteriophora TaxID=37862 RepID=A0A1I7X395_HETBA
MCRLMIVRPTVRSIDFSYLHVALLADIMLGPCRTKLQFGGRSRKRRLGSIELTKTIVSKVLIGSVGAEIFQQDYYLNIHHLQASLHGDYKHNVLFIEQKGDFRLNIMDLNATIGPLIPVNIGGLPYLHPDISCDPKKFNLNGSHGCYFYWRGLRKELRHFPTRNSGERSVMVFDVFSSMGLNVLRHHLVPHLHVFQALASLFNKILPSSTPVEARRLG